MTALLAIAAVTLLCVIAIVAFATWYARKRPRVRTPMADPREVDELNRRYYGRSTPPRRQP